MVEVPKAVLVACALLAAIAVAPARAGTVPLRPGQVALALGPDEAVTWNPRTGLPLDLAIQARFTRAQVRAGTTELFIRYGYGRHRCGPSPARGSGRLYDAVPVALADERGRLRIRLAGRRLTFTRPGSVRFCSWFARDARQRARAVVQDVALFDQLFGASMTASGSFGDARKAFWSRAISTAPFGTTISKTGCGGDPLPPRGEESTEPGTNGFYGFEVSGGGPAVPCSSSIGLAYRLLTGPIDRLDQGSVTLTGLEQAADVPPVRAAGNGCAMDISASLAIFEAQRYLRALGCRPGRIVYRTESSAPRGAVYDFEVNGARALLVPQGTAVDLVVNGRARSVLDPVSPELERVLRRYAGSARDGEQVVTARDAPIVPRRPGLVLLRFFIPGKLAAGGLLKGDNRGYSADPGASHRASLIWDTTSGRVVFRVVGSCRKGVRGFAFDPRNACRTALPLKEIPRADVWVHSDSRRATNLVSVGGDATGALRVRLSILNSYTNGFPGRAGAWSVDDEIVIRNTARGFATTIEGNGYPAIEGYFLPVGATGGVQAILRRDIERPHVKVLGPIRADGGGGDAAFDGASFADCTTDPITLRAITCVDRRNDGRTWTTGW